MRSSFCNSGQSIIGSNIEIGISLCILPRLGRLMCLIFRRKSAFCAVLWYRYTNYRMHIWYKNFLGIIEMSIYRMLSLYQTFTVRQTESTQLSWQWYFVQISKLRGKRLFCLLIPDKRFETSSSQRIFIILKNKL